MLNLTLTYVTSPNFPSPSRYACILAPYFLCQHLLCANFKIWPHKHSKCLISKNDFLCWMQLNFLIHWCKPFICNQSSCGQSPTRNKYLHWKENTRKAWKKFILKVKILKMQRKMIISLDGSNFLQWLQATEIHRWKNTAKNNEWVLRNFYACQVAQDPDDQSPEDMCDVRCLACDWLYASLCVKLEGLIDKYIQQFIQGCHTIFLLLHITDLLRVLHTSSSYRSGIAQRFGSIHTI